MSLIYTPSIAALISSAKANPPVEIIPFSAAPLYCASCLRVALWRGETELALRWAYTLAIFDPSILWKVVNLSVLENHATEAPTLLPLSLSASKAAKKLGKAWPVAAALIERVALSAKSGFFVSAARALTHEFFAPTDVPRCSLFSYPDQSSWLAAQQLFRDFWAVQSGHLASVPTPLYSALERLSSCVSWSRLDLAEAAWRATRCPSALVFAALEPTASERMCLNDCPTTEVSFNHLTPRGRQWLSIAPRQPVELGELSLSLRVDVFGEALWRVETEGEPSLNNPISQTQGLSLGGLPASTAEKMLHHIRANLAHIRANRRTHLGHLADEKPATRLV